MAKANVSPIVTMKAGKSGGIDSCSAAQQRMAELADPIDSLKGGTKAMRAKSTTYLPKFPEEKKKAYDYRLSGTFLFNGYGQTLRDLVAMPFSKEVDVKEREKLPEPLDRIEKNVDRRGTTISAFARDLLEQSVDRGLCFVLVDAPPAPKDGKSNLARDRKLDLRPYFVHIRVLDLLGVRSQTLEDGSLRVTQVRFKQCTTEPDGEYGEKQVERIRVVNAAPIDGARGSYELWRRDKTKTNDQWIREDAGPTSWKRDYLPFEVAYQKKVADFEAEPVLNDLASENLKHWRNSSSLQIGIEMGCSPMVAVSGMAEPTNWEANQPGVGGNGALTSKGVVVAPMNVIYIKEPNGKAVILETTGAALQVAMKHLTDSEERMQVLGLQALLEPGSAKFAKEVEATQGRSETGIQSMIREIEQLLEKCYQHAADWLGLKMPKKFSVDIHNEFGLGAKAVEEMRVILDMWKGGALPAREVIVQAKRRQFLGQNLDVDATLQEAKDDAPPLGALTRVQPATSTVPPKKDAA